MTVDTGARPGPGLGGFATLWGPIIGSFAVYLVPLVGPHALWLLGESLFQQLMRAENRDPWRLATNFAVAFAVQGALWWLLTWSLRSTRRLLTWIALIPALVVGMNTAYLVAIPSYFLIERDTAPERTGWTERCVVREASLLSIRTTVNQRATGVDRWWLQRPDGRYALLHLPDCTVADATLPTPTVQPGGHAEFMLGFHFTAPSGAATLQRIVPSTSAQTWWLLADPSTPLSPIAQPALAEGAPILSDTADTVAWLQRVAGSGPPILERVLIRPAQSTSNLPDVDIELAPFGAGTYTLLGVDTVMREVMLWQNERPILIGFDGDQRDLPFVPMGIRPQPSTYLRHRDGWVAWDAYRDDGPYQLSWSLAAGSGTHRTNKGRSITSAAIDPSGTLIAISETTTLNIGNAPDVVYVIRARDGADVFRRFLPRYSRSPVVFFEGGLFGYSDLGGTHVLNIVAGAPM